MASIFKILRSILPRSRPPADIESAGSLYVNFADAQLGIMDAAGLPLDLLALRYHKDTAGYVVDDIVAYGGRIYQCILEHDPETFDSAKWRDLLAKVYAYSKVSDVLDIPETYTPVLSLSVPNSAEGIYELKMAMTWQLNIANKSVYLRWREDGGAWTEAISEPKDRTDQTLSSYFYPEEWPGGDKLIEIEMRKEDVNGILNLHFLDIIWDQKN